MANSYKLSMGIVIMHSDGREGGEGRKVKIEDRIEEERKRKEKSQDQ